MQFRVGNDLSIQGVRYLVLGSIKYEDRQQGDRWEEYRLINHDDKTESWLSYDEGNNEYEMSTMVQFQGPPEGYSLVDSGTQVVREHAGSVDVDPGETAQYETWTDAEGKHTYSVERWSDETEYSRGLYVQKDDIQDLGPSPDANKAKANKKSGSGKLVLAMIIAMVACMAFFAIGSPSGSSYESLNNQLQRRASYTLVSEPNSNQDEDTADNVAVYSTTKSVSDASKEIITMLEGNISHANENEEKDTVAILTPSEYILVYQGAAEGEVPTDSSATSAGNKTPNTGSEAAQDSSTDEANSVEIASKSDSSSSAESTLSNDGAQTFVQISDRKHAYASDERPYRASSRSYRWYRAFYYGNAYEQDAKTYSSEESSYGKYTGETVSASSTPSEYETYAKSIRDQSAAKRTESGGGTAGGK